MAMGTKHNVWEIELYPRKTIYWKVVGLKMLLQKWINWNRKSYEENNKSFLRTQSVSYHSWSHFEIVFISSPFSKKIRKGCWTVACLVYIHLRKDEINNRVENRKYYRKGIVIIGYTYSLIMGKRLAPCIRFNSFYYYQIICKRS